MKKMCSCRLWIPIYIFTLAGLGVDGLRSVRVHVPIAVRRGESAVLRCLFDLEGDALYSVKWYKGGHEIYRFIPRETPSIKIFPIHGLDIEKSKSNATQLVLRKATSSFAGRYSCEVSADAPSFSTAFVSGDLNVVITPKIIPEVQGMKARYRVGDTLKATCISKNSKPAANLTWALNGQILGSDYIRQYNILKEPKNDLETSISTISFRLQKDHFKPNGRLKVRCTASIHNIYWRTSENSAEEERPKASVVAAQDYRLHDTFRKSNDIEFDPTPTVSSGCRYHDDKSTRTRPHSVFYISLISVYTLFI